MATWHTTVYYLPIRMISQRQSLNIYSHWICTCHNMLLLKCRTMKLKTTSNKKLGLNPRQIGATICTQCSRTNIIIVINHTRQYSWTFFVKILWYIFLVFNTLIGINMYIGEACMEVVVRSITIWYNRSSNKENIPCNPKWHDSRQYLMTEIIG